MIPVNPYQPPSLPEFDPGQPPRKRRLVEILFSFSGRIPRRTYWLWNMVLLGPLFLTGIGWGFFEESQKGTHVRLNDGGANPLVILTIFILAVPAFWIGLALRVKRWHDRDKSGLWVFLSIVPYIGGIWTFVECGCLRGTLGPNRFGEDPT